MNGLNFTGFTCSEGSKLYDGFVIEFDAQPMNETEGRRKDTIVFIKGNYMLKDHNLPLDHIARHSWPIPMRKLLDYRIKVVAKSNTKP
jgi:hypothetical protein